MVVFKYIDEKTVCSDQGIDLMQEAFAAALPFMEFVDQAIEASRS